MTTARLSETEARLRLHLLPGLGPRRFAALLSAFGDAASAWQAPASAWRALGLPASCIDARNDPEMAGQALASQHWAEAPDHHLLYLDDDAYPALLAELADAPPLLFVSGQVDLLQHPQLAVVGSRRASRLGLDTAFEFACSLAQAGFVVTSGLALGIDGAAHSGALQGGSTVAVLGTGLEYLYPARHRQLAGEIASGSGALVSELPLNTGPRAANFPRRNRIISGLSLGVLVVEASPSSGSLITARLAAEQGREVYAIPGSIHHPGARGCHQLIRQGATLVETIEDILEPLQGWLQPAHQDRQPMAAAPSLPGHPLLDLLVVQPLSSEGLAQTSGWTLPRVLAELTELEINQQVGCHNGLWYPCGHR